MLTIGRLASVKENVRTEVSRESIDLITRSIILDMTESLEMGR